MLSHAIKNILDRATGLKFSPVIGMSESFPVASYKLTPLTREKVCTDLLEVRLQGDDFDELEELREQVANAICTKTSESSVLEGQYVLRGKVSGGGILPMGEIEAFDSTQYFNLTWYKKGE